MYKNYDFPTWPISFELHSKYFILNITQPTHYANPFPKVFHIVSPFSKNDSFGFVFSNTKLNVGTLKTNGKSKVLFFAEAKQTIQLWMILLLIILDLRSIIIPTSAIRECYAELEYNTICSIPIAAKIWSRSIVL